MRVDVRGLTFGYGARPVLTDIDMDVAPGHVCVILCPNAVGKSTLLKCIAGLVKPSGTVLLDGRDAALLSANERTRLLSYVAQEGFSRVALTVFEVVLLGRLQSLRWRASEEDLDAVWSALTRLGVDDLATRNLNELSGGQKQLISIAQALVHGPQVLLLDEPTSSLDLQHRLEVLELIKALTAGSQITALISLHDLTLAARFADDLVVLRDGAVYSRGTPDVVLTAAMVRTVYGVNAEITRGSDGLMQVTALSSVRNAGPALASP